MSYGPLVCFDRLMTTLFHAFTLTSEMENIYIFQVIGFSLYLVSRISPNKNSANKKKLCQRRTEGKE